MTPHVRDLLARLDSGQPVVTEPMELVHCRINDRPVTFCVDLERDPIQRHHRRGKFYETPELDQLRALVAPGATYFDVGANTGNHALFFAFELGASRVIPIEPNPLVYRLLISNVVTNGLRDVIDLNFLGVGLSATRTGGFAMEQRARNIGAARMLPAAGDIDTHPGDTLLAGTPPDVIKIDVEGMEMDVLGGFEQTIRRHRPLIYIEVDTGNDDAFQTWVADHDYSIAVTHQRYEANRNFILTPTV